MLGMHFQYILNRNSFKYSEHLGKNESEILDTSVGIGDNKDNKYNKNELNNSGDSLAINLDTKMQRRIEPTVGNVQLTPLWEHILRTRRLPETICPTVMFAEFHERLQDPEWQVRQHALRVLVDVLVVMKSKADKHCNLFLTALIKNLGHQAPTIRKGTLDCLRVYLSETQTPEIIISQIFDTGLNQKPTYDERLHCGVLLALPALIQSILCTPQRILIIKNTIERLMQQLRKETSHQEITLKVLSKISHLIGIEQFERHFTGVEGNNRLTLYRHLCKVYGISSQPRADDISSTNNVGAWRALPREQTWRNSTVTQSLEPTTAPENGKIIMETEIKINDDTLTMRILEAETENEDADSPSIGATELVCRPLLHMHTEHNIDTGILQIISDSEVEEVTDASSQYQSLLGTPSRGLKRVTFGGEVVKMRTPDSDVASSTIKNVTTERDEPAIIHLSTATSPEQSKTENFSQTSGDITMTELTLEIPSDNTKPLLNLRSPPQTKQSPKECNNATIVTESDLPTSSSIRDLSHSPAYRSCSISPSMSPKPPHKEIEVLHNLQRDFDTMHCCSRRNNFRKNDTDSPTLIGNIATPLRESPTHNKSWEDLDIVSYKTIVDLRSADWRNRQQGIVELETALSSSSNLLLVKPYLDSLLRTLLSSERNLQVAEVKREILINLISRLPLDNLEERTQQILSGLCRQGNAGANRVCKALMQRLPAGTIVAKLTTPEYLHGKSSKFRDHALQMSIYALMTFPGTCFDINILTTHVTYVALNRKCRVRHAALEVFAVLADISSVDEVLKIVSAIVHGIESGSALLKAVKARLLRLQLPLITAEGAVMPAFPIYDHNKNMHLGADVDWIKQGEGSTSPNAIKRRHMHTCARLSLKKNKDIAGTTLKYNYQEDENLHRHSFHSPPEALEICKSTNHELNLSQICGSSNRRLVTHGNSETSMDGRSSDSTTTTCSSASGTENFTQMTRIKHHLDKQLLRFPVIRQHSDYINNFERTTHSSQYNYRFENLTANVKNHQCPTTTLIGENSSSGLKWLSTVSGPCSKEAHGNIIPKDSCHRTNSTFNNLDRFKSRRRKSIQIDKSATSSVDNITWHVWHSPRTIVKRDETPSQLDLTTAQQVGESSASLSSTAATFPSENLNQNGDGSPLSIKSASYSQKSTASAKSQRENTAQGKRQLQQSSVHSELESPNLTHQFSDLIVNDIEDETEFVPAIPETMLKRNESINSLHSKTESIKTQIEDATPQLSRAQSIKSLAIEEDIENSNSFVVVGEVEQENESSGSGSHSKEQAKPLESIEISSESVSPSSTSRHSNNLYEDRIMQSRSISLDSIYEGHPPPKHDPIDILVCATDNDLHSASHKENIKLPTKQQHTPLKHKSKTSYFLRGQRRISPVKQAIKMPQTELFPSNMLHFEKPREALVKTFDQLDSTNWEVNMIGLKCVVRLIRYHSDLLDSHMHMTCIQLTRSVRNLRSQVARAACQAATELFTLKCKSLEIECDDLVCALLHRTADTNRFLRADATRALESMVDNIQPGKVLNILTTKGAQHQNALVRTTTAKLLFRLVQRLGNDRVYAMAKENRDKLFMVGANLLLEGSLETRSYAKSLFRVLSDHVSYQRILLEIIPPRTYRNVEKTLRSITRLSH